MLDRGRKVLVKVLNDDDYSDDDPPSNSSTKKLPCSITDLQDIFECLLCFHAWAKCSRRFDISPQGVSHMKYAIGVMLQKIKNFLPRAGSKNGWNIQKFHDLTHLPDDICRFGSPQNTDAGPGERSLKFFAKRLAKTSRQEEGAFQEQVPLWLQEVESIAKAKRLTDPANEWNIQDSCIDNVVDNDDFSVDSNQSANITFFGTNPSFQLLFNDYTGVFGGIQWNRKRTTKGLVEIHPLLINWFLDDKRKRCYEGSLRCWTHCTLNIDDVRKKEDRIFWSRGPICLQAHPNFQSRGPWYDWVLVNFASDDGNIDCYPCKILTFFLDPVHGNFQALVHASDYKDEKKNGDSVICEEWFLKYDELTVSVPVPDANQSTRTRKE